MAHTPGRTAVITFIAVLLLSLLLPIAQEQFWFAGHGFGTTLAQQLFWTAYRIVGSSH